MKGKRWLEDRGTIAKVKKRVLALSQGTNQAMSRHYVEDQIISGSDLRPCIELTYVEMVQVICSR